VCGGRTLVEQEAGLGLLHEKGLVRDPKHGQIPGIRVPSPVISLIYKIIIKGGIGMKTRIPPKPCYFFYNKEFTKNSQKLY
jgi:hypothetical protein